MKKNPILLARNVLHLSQQEVADELGVTQQYIQRLELGQIAQVPPAVGLFYDSRLSEGDYYDILGQLLELPTASIVREKFPELDPAKATFNKNQLRLHYLYRFYVAIKRRELPDLSRFLRTVKEKASRTNIRYVQSSRMFTDLCWLIGIEDLERSKQVYTVATILHLSPTILSRWISNGGFPPTLEQALLATKRD